MSSKECRGTALDGMWYTSEMKYDRLFMALLVGTGLAITFTAVSYGLSFLITYVAKTYGQVGTTFLIMALVLPIAVGVAYEFLGKEEKK